MSNRVDGQGLNPGHRETLFATPQWFAIWAEAFGRESYGVWRRPGANQTLAIPYLRQNWKIAGFPVALARAAANFFTPRYDVIGGPCDPGDLEAMLRDLNVACLELSGVSEHSSLVDAIDRSADPSGVQRDLFESAPFVDCTVGWSSYWATRGKNLRANLATAERRLRDSRVELLRLSDWQDIGPQLETIYAIEASGWKGRQGTAITQDPTVKSFYDRLIYELSGRDLIRLFLLRVDGEVVAFELATLYLGVLTGLKGGFREAHAKLSPGQLLRQHFLQWAFAVPEVELYDLQGPSSVTKLRWATGAETLLTIRLFRRSFRGLLCRSRFVVAPKVKAVIRRTVRPTPDVPDERERDAR
jgi:hypothetical protein